jgi:hypothetical protein
MGIHLSQVVIVDIHLFRVVVITTLQAAITLHQPPAEEEATHRVQVGETPAHAMIALQMEAVAPTLLPPSQAAVIPQAEVPTRVPHTSLAGVHHTREEKMALKILLP